MEHNDQSVQHYYYATSSLNYREQYLTSFPPGYKFDPTDAELITSYLQPKIHGELLPVNLMHEINIYKHNPEHLAVEYRAQGTNSWYFFTSRDKKYPKGKRPNRRAGDGYWKATGADKVITQGGIEVGFRRALVFYRGRPPMGKKTRWIMHEFRVTGPSLVKKKKITSNHEDTSMRLDDFVLCRIYEKKEEATGKKKSRSKRKVGIEDKLKGASPQPETPSNCVPPPDNTKPHVSTTDDAYYSRELPVENTGFPNLTNIEITPFMVFSDNQSFSFDSCNFCFSDDLNGGFDDFGDESRFFL